MTNMNKKPEFNYQKARKFLENKFDEKKKANEKLFSQAKNDFHSILDLIVSKYNPARIYQWGSLLNQNAFKDYSDIDIAVEGILSAETFFNLYKDIEPLTDFPLDIVQIEKIAPEFRNTIKRKGKIVYERDQTTYSST